MGSVDTLVPDLPESVADATVATWYRKPGDVVVRDEVLVEIETGKVVLEVPASAGGTLNAVLEGEGTAITFRQILGRLREGNSAGKETNAKSKEKTSTPAQCQQASLEEQNNDASGPVIRRLLAGHSLGASTVKGTSMSGRLTRGDMERHLAKAPARESAPTTASSAVQPVLATRSEKRVPTTHLRKRVTERLLEAKSPTTMLTTLNEVNVKSTMDLRKQYGEAFEERHGIRLGFMSFYVETVAEALKHYPEVNASIDDDDMVYHNYSDVSMTVSTPHGLMAPVLRGIGTLSIADIREKIRELAVKGRDGKLTVEDLTGGNFTITNDGMFGSLISTPIINPPQSAILGMHAIKDRPMAVDSRVKILPMMYLAPSYGHRLIDGRESMGFLVTIKKLLEDPTRLLLDM